MNVDSLSTALSHIGFLVVNLTKKNFSTSFQDLKEVSDMWVFCEVILNFIYSFQEG